MCSGACVLCWMSCRRAATPVAPTWPAQACQESLIEADGVGKIVIPAVREKQNRRIRLGGKRREQRRTGVRRTANPVLVEAHQPRFKSDTLYRKRTDRDNAWHLRPSKYQYKKEKVLNLKFRLGRKHPVVESVSGMKPAAHAKFNTHPGTRPVLSTSILERLVASRTHAVRYRWKDR